MLHYVVGPRGTRDEKRQASFCTSSIVVTKGAAFPAMLSSIEWVTRLYARYSIQDQD